MMLRRKKSVKTKSDQPDIETERDSTAVSSTKASLHFSYILMTFLQEKTSVELDTVASSRDDESVSSAPVSAPRLTSLNSMMRFLSDIENQGAATEAAVHAREQNKEPVTLDDSS